MKEIYLDNAANTALDERVLEAMKPFLSTEFVGNANAIHDYGVKAGQAITDSRKIMGESFGIDPQNVIFTSGATESNNTAIKAVCFSELHSGEPKKKQRRHIICSAFEHASVLNTCKQMEEFGFKVDYVKTKNGLLDGSDIIPLINKDTLLICIMAVNNETGVEITGLNKLFETTSEKGIYTLCDCTQFISLGLGDGDFEKVRQADFISFSGHKIKGPTGVGALLCSEKGLECVKKEPLIMGGAQEFGSRGGTSNTAGIVGLAKAVELEAQEDYRSHFLFLKNHLIEQLQENRVIGKVLTQSWGTSVISLCLSRYFEKYEIDSLASLLASYGVAVSAGSACDANHDETQGSFNPSHVLTELGLTEKEIRCTIRVSFSKDTSFEDLDILVERIVQVKKDLDDLSEQ